MSIVNSSPNTKDHKIVVFGASGHTGRFVVSELARRGMTAILVGRDRKKLFAMRTAQPAFEVRVASVDDPVSLDRALQDAALVINCAGPFLDTATPIIEAAVRAQIHYVDVTAEQAVALAAFEKFSDAARKAGVLIVPSAAFYGALGDLLATTAVRGWPSAAEIQIAVALDSWKPTRGTRLTGQRNPGRRLVFSKNRLSPVEDPPPKLNWKFPAPFGSQEMIAFPLAETILISRHIRAPEIHSYINLAPISDLHDPHTPPRRQRTSKAIRRKSS